MKYSFQSLPKEYQDEYLRRETAFFRSRVGLYCVIATSLYFLVSAQFLIRKIFFNSNTFRWLEFPFWLILLVGTLFCHRLNRSWFSMKVSKISALIYTLFFLWSFSGLSVLYPESEFVFVFYYAFALLLSSLMVPWSPKEIGGLSVLYALAFFLSYDYVVYVMKYPIQSLPRFYPSIDGVIFMGVASFISITIRKKETGRDLHSFVLRKKVEDQNSQFEKELNLARHVHETLIPTSISTDRVDVKVSYVPMGYVSGDYAKLCFLDKNRLFIFISDVTGHGVPAALLVNRVHAELERLVNENPEPGALLGKLNTFILKDFKDMGMYLSAFCAILDLDKSSIVYSNYGHPTQYLYSAQNTLIQNLSAQTAFLGISEDQDSSLYQTELKFELGDRLLLFTDGVIEATSANGEFYGEKRLLDFLQNNANLIGDDFNKQLLAALHSFNGGLSKDDIFILNIKTKVAQESKLLATHKF